MHIKDYLLQASRLDQTIDNKLEQVQRLKDIALKVTISYEKEIVSGGGCVQSPMADTVNKLVDLEKEINKDIDKLVDLKREIIELIRRIDDSNHRLLLERRYLNGYGWDEVADEIGYDKRWVMRLHGRALKEIDKFLKQATKSH